MSPTFLLLQNDEDGDLLVFTIRVTDVPAVTGTRFCTNIRNQCLKDIHCSRCVEFCESEQDLCDVLRRIITSDCLCPLDMGSLSVSFGAVDLYTLIMDLFTGVYGEPIDPPPQEK